MPPVAKPVLVKKSAPKRIRGRGEFNTYEASFNPASEDLRPVSMPAIRLEWRAASALLLVLLSVALYLGLTSPYFMVNTPVISGNQFISAGEINSVLKLSGKSIFLLTPSQIERELQITLPTLSGVSISVSLPNRVNVVVTERQPIVAWQQQDGGMAWIDVEGIAIQPRTQIEGLITVLALGPPPAPLVAEATANELAPPPFISPVTVAALQALKSSVPAGTQLIYDPQNGLGWNDSHGWVVQLGDVNEELALKLRIYETMVNWFAQENIHPILVSVAYPHNPFYRTEP